MGFNKMKFIPEVKSKELPDNFFLVDGSSFYEIDYTTLTSVSSISNYEMGITSTLAGVGGTLGRLYVATTQDLYEIDVITKIVINSYHYTNDFRGIGGTVDRLYVGTYDVEQIREIDLYTFLSVNSEYTGHSIVGAGGVSDRIYCIYSHSASSQVFHELDKDTLVSINSNNPPNNRAVGIGGLKEQLFSGDYANDEIYELDIATLIPIKTVSTDLICRGVGGMKNDSRLIQHKVVVKKASLDGVTFGLNEVLVDTKWQ